MKKIKILAVLFLIMACGQSCRRPISPAFNFDYQDKIPGWLAENHVPAVGIGIIEDGRIKYLRVFGELRENVPAPADTIFSIASQTKPVVAMLTLKLVESGQWNLDEPLDTYWTDPDVLNDPLHKKLTTRHILSHQTGFVNWRRDHPSKKLTFDFEPGTKFQYSGEGFEYLRRALENKFHEPLEKLLESRIFKPLGMKDTQYWSEALDTTRLAGWHDAKGMEYKISHKTSVNAADNLLTTIEDYCIFGIDVMNGAGLSANLFKDMISPQVEVKKHYYRGLGWGLVKDLPHGEYALEHGGSDPGVKTEAIFWPRSKKGIVVMTNGDNGVNVYKNVIEESIDLGKMTLDAILQSSSVHKIITLSDEMIRSYAGTYIRPNGNAMFIVQEGQAIKVSGDGIPTFLFYPEADNKFFIKDFDVQLEFIRDENHKVVKLAIYENGKKGMEALKK